MPQFKFNQGQRVVVGPNLNYGDKSLGGEKGVVGQVWPKAGLLNQNQYQVVMDYSGFAIVFNEDQLELDVLEELAGL